MQIDSGVLKSRTIKRSDLTFWPKWKWYIWMH